MNIIQGNRFREFGDYKIEGKPLSVELPVPREIILFIKTDYIPQFKFSLLPHIGFPFKIITHNSDLPITEKHIDLLNHPLLIKWYGMNCHITHKNLTPIPIGIANAEWPHGNISILQQIITENIIKSNLIYCNYDPTTNPSVRYPLIEQLKLNKNIVLDFVKKSYEDYLRTVSTYKYIISPEGNSVDCHRIWEAIYLGVIPIVKKHKALETFEDLPILFVNDWEELNNIDLISVRDKLLIRDRSKADFDYYRKLINE